MKIRNGFVSNSSSSSFMLIGVEVNETGLNLEELEKLGFDFADECKLVGVYCYIDEYDIGDFSMDFINESANSVREKLGKEPRLYCGTEGC